ncbi:hypothetical protein [Pseudothauera rhizosphaerae]|uniref:Uncharacterized protein n=1 Tax=Pseudothauera rhizosphaerae TaxID=2565932 RepID=A0A4S4AXF9_9RHOO|nr:hypothetical protein [Pseudothauera rhizosphaerae]THF64323.1 hypothetical protein E6O51_03155 [Pseudothauera rhizosphaerae]
MEAIPKPQRRDFVGGPGGIGARQYREALAEWEKYEAARVEYAAVQAEIERESAAFAAEQERFAAEQEAFKVAQAAMQAQQKKDARGLKKLNQSQPQGGAEQPAGMVSTSPDSFGGATMLTSPPPAAPTALSTILSNLLGR